MKKVIHAALHGSDGEDSEEFLPYRVAFWGVPLSILGVAFWCWLAGMSLWLAAAQMTIYMLVVAVVMTRSTAEAGLMMTETTFRPLDIIRMFVPMSGVGAANLTLTGFMDPIFFRDQRGLMLTAFMDGMKISDGVGMRRRQMIFVFTLAILVAFVTASAIQIWLAYDRGAINLYSYLTMMNPTLSFNTYAPSITNPTPLETSSIGFTVIGIVFTLFLTYMRLNFFWWPLHPLGYALSNSWGMFVFWFPCLVAWIVKGLIIRYGGMRFYMRARPFFLGMILGEFTLALLWTLISWRFNCSAPDFPWP